MKYILIKNGKGEITGFTVGGENYTLKQPMIEKEFKAKIGHSSVVDLLADDTLYSFKSGGGTSSSSQGDSTALLTYIFTRDKLFQGTELTESDDSIPDTTNNKGFLTSATESPLLDFYKAFAYNDDNYKLIINSPNVEVSFLVSDRRYGVAGSRRAWSPYFKINDLVKQSFTDIQNRLVGSDATPEYFFKAKITVNANGNLFITFIDGHSGVNLYGAVLNIRHRVV